MSKFVVANMPGVGGIYLNVDYIVSVSPHSPGVIRVEMANGKESNSYLLNGNCDDFFRVIGITPVEF